VRILMPQLWCGSCGGWARRHQRGLRINYSQGQMTGAIFHTLSHVGHRLTEVKFLPFSMLWELGSN
jgi:hypothetical protein